METAVRHLKRLVAKARYLSNELKANSDLGADERDEQWRLEKARSSFAALPDLDGLSEAKAEHDAARAVIREILKGLLARPGEAD